MNVIDNRKFDFPDELFEEDEFNRLVSFSKCLSDQPTQDSSTIVEPTVREKLPQAFGKYELTRLLGSDRVGKTFLARYADSNREFSVKKISEDHAERLGPKRLRKQLHKLRNESMATNAVFAKNVISIFEVGDIDGQYFYSVGYTPGKSLAKVVDSKTVSNRIAASTLKDIADSLDQLHKAGVFHRDLNPENIVIDNDSLPFILPGPSVLLDSEVSESSAFMAPEITDRSAIDAAAEVWSLGAILYNCLVGEPPSADSAIVSPRKRNPKVARDLATICMKCLSQKPNQRYSNAARVAEDLDRFLEYQPIGAKPTGLIDKLINKLSRMG